MRWAWLLLALVACASPSGDPVSDWRAPSDGSLDGLEIVYRFDIGRVYRARYGASEVSFELLEPSQPDPPSGTIPYSSLRIGEGVYMVTWDGAAAQRTTLVIDLPGRLLHASFWRGEAGRLLATARILDAPPD